MVMFRLIILTVFVLVNDTDNQADHKFCIPLLQQIAMLSGADKQLGGGGGGGYHYCMRFSCWNSWMISKHSIVTV